MNSMKHIIILALIFYGVNVYAQPSQRQKMIHMAAVRISDTIQVKESNKDAEAKILSDFGKSAKLLELRKKYYFEFRKILSPPQIQKMYDMEYDTAVSRR